MVVQGFNAYFNQNPLLVLYLVVHFLVDYHFQSLTMANKKTDIRYVSYHLLVVTLGFGALLVFLPTSLSSVLLIIVAHALIDMTKYFVTHRLT